MADGLRDRNPQKEQLFQVWLTLAATSSKLRQHGEMIARADANDSSFGAAIEHVYLPDDPQHTKPVSMVLLAIEAFEWVEGKLKTTPEWIKHSGLAD